MGGRGGKSGAKITEKALDKSEKSGIIESDNSKAAGDGVLSEYTSLGFLETSYLEKEFGKLQTNEIIVTNERLDHIKGRHMEDYQLFNKMASVAVSDPDLVLKDIKNEGTVFVVKKLEKTNLNVVVRLALATDEEGLKNSVMTFYRIRDKNLKKLKNKHEVLYKKE